MAKIPFSTFDEGIDYFTRQLEEINPNITFHDADNIFRDDCDDTIARAIQALQNKAYTMKSLQEFYDYGVKSVIRNKRIIVNKREKEMEECRKIAEKM